MKKHGRYTFRTLLCILPMVICMAAALVALPVHLAEWTIKKMKRSFGHTSL